MTEQHYGVLIVGGGAAGVSVANNLRKVDAKVSIGLIEPSEKHYYQPGFTLVGGGVFTLPQTLRQQADLIPASVSWIKDAVAEFHPEQNTVQLTTGSLIGYDYLVVCPGLQLDWDKIPGLRQTLGKNYVCSNYSPDTVEYTWQCLQQLQSGTLLFTQPPMPIKCAGAPQKIMYLTADRLRKKGILNKFTLEFCTATPAMFSVPFFAKALNQVVADYGIKTQFNCNLIAIDGDSKTATFEITDAEGGKQIISKTFDMIHVTPPQSAPDFIKNSPLANSAGWVDLNDNTLQHNRYPNIFGLGDAGSTPNAKTAAAIRKQVPVVVDNILGLMADKEPVAGYDGYGSCPLTTSLNTVMLAEFTYGGKVTPSFPLLDPRKNRKLWWWGKTTGFPWLYWHIMLKGRRIDIPHLADYAKSWVDKS